MDKFLGTYDLPKIRGNKSVIISEAEATIKGKPQDQMGSLSTPTNLTRRTNTNTFKLFHDRRKETMPNSLCKASITMTLKPHNDTITTTTKKKFRQISLIGIDTKTQ